jgi:hypothetical protein
MRRLALIALLLVATNALADWPPGGRKLMGVFNSFNGIRRVFFLDHPSGDLYVVGVGKGNASNFAAVQRVSRTGDIDSQWPALGALFLGGTWPVDGYSEYTGFAVDDSGNVWHSWASWNSSPLGTQTELITPAGEQVGYGLVSTSGDGQASDVVALPGGDVLVMCGASRLQRFTRSGTVAPGWPALGVAVLPSGDFDTELMNDGAGGAIIYSHDYSSPPRVTRFDGSGIRHSGWPPAGLTLSSSTQLPSDDLLDNLFPSGPDHALAAWTRADVGADSHPNGKKSILVQRFGVDGTLDPGWPAEAVVAVASDTIRCSSAIPDGAGGAYLLWEAHGAPRMNHVLVDGTVIGGDHGISFLDGGALYLPMLHILTGPETMICDKTDDGELVVGWNDARLSPAVSFRLRWFRPDLTASPIAPDTGVVVFPLSTSGLNGSLRAVRSDGPSGAFVAWAEDLQNPGPLDVGEVWMTHVTAPVTVGVGPPSTRPFRLALSAPRPNPSRGIIAFDVTLPDDSPARVELLDIAGRVQRTQVVQGPGAHAVKFGAAGPLAPGLYFARVVHPTGASSVRVVVAR